VHIGDRRTLVQGVTDAGPKHDHRAASRLEQPEQVDLLQSGLPVRPCDGAVQRQQYRRGGRPGRAGPAVQVVQDAAAFRGDRRERRGQLDRGERSHLQYPHQGDREEHGGDFRARHDHRHLLVIGDAQG